MTAVLLSRRWLGMHLLALVVIAACVAMTWWQFGRAAGGNARSIGYAFQWPGIAIFTVGVWAWLCRDAVRVAAGTVRPEPKRDPRRVDDDLVLPPARPNASRPVTDEDPTLAQYNDMLARLARQDRK